MPDRYPSATTKVASPGDPVRPHYGFTLLVLAIAGTSFTLMQTMVAPALPTIQAHYGVSAVDVAWVLTIYALAASIATPIIGRFGDMFGKRKVLLLVLVAFGTGTLVCALSGSLAMLIGGRAVQGVGGAIFPLAFGIVRDEFPPKRVGTGIGLLSSTFGIGGALGLVIAGPIVDNLNFHWLFWLSCVGILVGLVFTYMVVPESPIRSPARIDWTGAFLLSVGLGAVLFALSRGNDWGWVSTEFLVLMCGGLGLLLIFVWIESRITAPLVDMAMMRARSVWTTNVSAVFVGFGMFASLLIIPQFVQMPVSSGFGLGADVTQAGLFMLPSAAVMLIAGPFAGWLGSRVSSKLALMMGIVSAGTAFTFLAMFHDHAWQFYAASALIGAGLGMSWASMAALIVDGVGQDQTSVATGMNMIMRSGGAALYAPVGASILGASIGVSGLPTERAFEVALLVSTGALILAFLAASVIPARRRPVDRLAPGVRGHGGVSTLDGLEIGLGSDLEPAGEVLPAGSDLDESPAGASDHNRVRGLADDSRSGKSGGRSEAG